MYFFRHIRPWSKRKHRILGKYILPFSAKVGIGRDRIFLIDAFAGPGIYRSSDAAVVEEGSPLLMARAADKALSWESPRTLRLINVELDASNYLNLVENTSEWVDRGIVTNLEGDYSTRVHEILALVGQSPAFFFLDPFNPTNLPFAAIKPVLNRNVSKTELLINFNLTILNRLASKVNEVPVRAGQASGIEKTLNRVTAVMGNDRWRTVFTDSTKSSQAKRNWLLRDFMASLGANGHSVLAYPIRPSLDKAPRYYLIFCSRHPDAFQLMNEFIRAEEDEMLYTKSEDSFPLFAATNQNDLGIAIELRRKTLSEILSAAMRERRSATRDELLQDIVTAHFAEYSQKDVLAVVQEMLKTGFIRSETGLVRINGKVKLYYRGR